MIATSNAAALVKGAAAPAARLVKVEVTRAFCMKGERVEVGATLEVPEALARELMSNGKVVPFVEKPAAKPAPRAQEKK